VDHHLTKPLDFAEQLYVLEYIECRSYKVAGERTGMPQKDWHLLTKRKAFSDEVERLTSTVLGRAEVTAQRIVDELASIAFDDERNHIDKMGNLKLGDKIRALELLGKWSQIKLFTEVVETNATDDVARVKTVDLEERIKLMETSRDASLIEPE
jgi:hypothetical protein